MAVWVVSNRRWKWLTTTLLSIIQNQEKRSKREDQQEIRIASIEKRVSDLEQKK